MRWSVVAIVLAFGLSAQEPPSPAPSDFAGGYANLRPEQKRLVDDWFQRFSLVVKKPIDPSEGYDKLPLSTRTTFNAVTHALLNTRLTTESGESLAPSAIELVEKVDSAAGEVLGARGDAQFRIYVQMKPSAVDLLSRSQEFKHVADNTVYHKGYPTCYRTKGVPSIQISLTRDAKRADIDVDYRSSKFPVSFINGHLNASNSDVRADDNDVRHNNQWAGLQNWWRNLLGLPLADTSSIANSADRVLAQQPPTKNAKPADAVYGFLHSWLVEQKPNESFGYFAAEEVVACLELERRVTADRGMSKFVLVENMLAANSRLGKVALLKDVTESVNLSNQRLKPIQQPHVEFALYDVREDLAEEFDCANRLDSTEVSQKAAKSHEFGKYIGAVFRVRTKGETGNVVATLWRKENGYWKLISYDIDPQIDRSTAPNVGAPEVVVPPLAVVEGDKGMVDAASTFLKLWLVTKDIDQALQYVAPECLPCVTLYRADDSRSLGEREALKSGMSRVAAQIGPTKNLGGAIAAPEVHHPDMKLVKHRDNRSFAILSLPEYMGDAARCDHRDSDGNPTFVGGAATGYGKYYATGFTLNEGRSSPAVLWIVWNRGSGSWKATSYILMTP